MVFSTQKSTIQLLDDGCQERNINQRSGLLGKKRRQPLSFASDVALYMQLEVNLVDILLDAALGEKQLFCDLAVTQTFRHQKHDPIFPIRQRVDHGGSEDCINVRVAIGQRTALGKRPKIQIDSGKPAFTGIEQGICLHGGEVVAAAEKVCYNKI